MNGENYYFIIIMKDMSMNEDISWFCISTFNSIISVLDLVFLNSKLESNSFKLKIYPRFAAGL